MHLLRLSFQQVLQVGQTGFPLPIELAGDDWLGQLEEASWLPFADEGDLCAALDGLVGIASLGR